MEPQRHEIKAGLALLEEFSEKSENEAKQLPKIASLWTSLISAGMTLVSGNLKLRRVEDDWAKFFADGQAIPTLRAIVEQRGKFLQCLQSLEKLAEECKPQESEEPDAMDTLLQLKPPEAFRSELDCSSFDDGVSFKAGSYGRLLDEASFKYFGNVKAFLKKKASEEEKKVQKDSTYTACWMPDEADYEKVPYAYSEEGELNWKKDLTTESSFAQVNEAAKQTIMQYLPAMAIKEFVDTVSQAAIVYSGVCVLC